VEGEMSLEKSKLDHHKVVAIDGWELRWFVIITNRVSDHACPWQNHRGRSAEGSAD
jgi:hypothetical protein